MVENTFSPQDQRDYRSLGIAFSYPLSVPAPSPRNGRNSTVKCLSLFLDFNELILSRFHLRLASTDVVYLSSSRVVSEILEKRSAKTSSRPPLPMVSDIVSGGKRMVMMPYNATWRNIRKLMHQASPLAKLADDRC
jgi:hypothetical protein